MKKFFKYLLLTLLATSLVGCANYNKKNINPQPTAKMTITNPVKLDAKGVIEMSGTGFQQGEVTLLFTTADDVQSDIGYALDPAPMADAQGNWKTKWSYGRFVKKKLVKVGGYEVSAVDDDFNVLSSVTIQFTE